MNRRAFIALSTAAVQPNLAVSFQASAQRFKKGICNAIVPNSIPLDEAFQHVKKAGSDGIAITMGSKLTLKLPPPDSRGLRPLPARLA